MAKRRANQEGTLFKEKTTGLWVGEVSLPDGKRKRKRNKSQAVIKEWLLKERKLLSEGIVISDEKSIFGNFIDRWYAEVAVHKLRDSTLIVHESVIRLHIKPKLGEIRLSQLKPSHLSALYSEKLNSGLSKRTVRYIHTVIHQALNYAMKLGLVARNVSDAVETPAPTRKKVVPLNRDEVVKLLEAIKGDRLYALYVIYLACGLRRGEALALTKDCVDIDNGLIYVKKTIVPILKKGLVVGEPKSEKSRRVVALPEFALEAIKTHLENQTVKSDYVFCTSNGTPFSPRNILRHFKNTLKKADLPETIRIHDLRHTFVSFLLAENVPPKDVQEIVGHADFGTTMNIYGHMMPNANLEAARKMNRLFKQ